MKTAFIPAPAGTYWVVPGKLLAGGYPIAKDLQGVQDWVNALLESGIRCVINLIDPSERLCSLKASIPYEETLLRQAQARGLEATVESMPIKATWVPSRKQMGLILDRIDQLLLEGKPVYAHCWAGRGRTGTVVGCYLARHGHAQDRKVLELMDRLRAETPDSTLASPESFVQIDMVLSWVEGE